MSSATPVVSLTVIEGDLFAQDDCDALVNPYNRNCIPWWLLIPGGVSGTLKRRAGAGPFRELAAHGVLSLGEAVTTSGGQLPQKIIHVAGLTHWWTATEESVRTSVRNVVGQAGTHGFRSIAMPVIGSGHGKLSPVKAEALIRETLWGFEGEDASLEVRVVRFSPEHH